MSERPAGRRFAAFEAIAEALEDPAGRATFARGLLLGALAGAAVAGSVLRARRAARPRSDTAREGAADPTADLAGDPAGDSATGLVAAPVRGEPDRSG